MKQTLFSIVIFCGLVYADGGVIRSSENYRIYPSSVVQTEVFVTRHPGQSQTLFATANTVVFNPFFISEGVYYTTDGGAAWQGSDTLQGNPVVFHGGDPGVVIDKDGTVIVTRLGIDPFPGIYAHYSTDLGTSWSDQVVLTQDEIERAAIASDVFPGSPFYGRTYVVFVKISTISTVWLSYSDNGGAAWSVPQQINNPQQRSSGADVAIAADGRVLVCWAGVTSISPFSETHAGFAGSTDGGQTWQIAETAFEMSGIQGDLPQKANIRVNGLPRITVDNSGGQHHGWIYIVTTEKNRTPAGSDPDVILYRSSDSGQSWLPGTRVNQDPLNNGKIQYFPAHYIDEGGGVNVLFYDDRLTSSDSTGVFLARSVDGGDSWTEIQVSDKNFKPTPIAGLDQGYQGDNIDLSGSGSRLIPLWMDNRSGIYQIWTAGVEISTVGIRYERPGIPQAPELQQNYPNPFNPVTTIAYRLFFQRGNSGAQEFAGNHVKLMVYDVLGRVVRRLVDNIQPAGSYQVSWDGRDEAGNMLPSGVYMYRLVTGNFTLTRKMLFIE